MPVDIFSIISSAKDILKFIIDRICQLKLSENIVSRIKENLEYLQQTIKKIEPYLKKDSDTKEIIQFLSHLQSVSKSCDAIAEEHTVVKFAKAPGNLIKLHSIETEIKMATDKLGLFMTANTLMRLFESTDFQNEILSKIATIRENKKAGLNIIEDKSIRRPPAPPGFNVQENKNIFILSWKPCGGHVDEYEVCYNEHENLSILITGALTSIELESPRVKPGNIYAMKIRGINKGGKGAWSKTVIGQFTKPLPQNPEISDLLLRSTIAVVTVKIPGVICNTESPITCVKISYISGSNQEFSSCEFEIEPGNNPYVFTITGLHPKSKYKFTAETKNAEGWSKLSNIKEGDTSSLPPKPTKPNPPIIETCTSTKVIFTVQVPENTCGIKSPIIAWKVFGYSGDKKEVNKYYLLDKDDFMKKSLNLTVPDLNPIQQYTLYIQVKNENGWSEPSKQFKIHIATPSTPKNVRVSSKRTHSLIKIRWSAPDSPLITHYEIVSRTKTDNYKNENIVKAPANKFSATFINLKHKTYYYFKIRTCNDCYASEWSEEVETNTRIHKGIKAGLSPLVWAAGTVTSPLVSLLMPVIAPVGAAVAAGEAASEKTDKKAVVAAAGVAGAVGGVVGGVAYVPLGIVTAPMVGAVYAHMFVHGTDELSDQSDEEDAVIID